MKTIDLDNETEKKWLKALVYGKSGTGKTGFAVTAPKVLILLNEIQAVPNIRGHAKRIGRPVYGVLHMQCVQDYRQVLSALRADPSKPFVVRDVDGAVTFERAEFPDTVAIDSLTEACELIAKEIRDQSPPKDGKDGLPVDSERYWNVFADRAGKLIRSFRDVERNVLFLCLLDDKEFGEEGAKQRWIGPSLTMRKLPAVVQAAVNVVGITRRTLNKDKSSAYSIGTYGPSFMETKPFPPLRPDEVPDFTSWCNRVAGIDDGSVVPEAFDEEPQKPVDKKDAKPSEKVAEKPAPKKDAKTDKTKVDAKQAATTIETLPGVPTTETASTTQEAQA